MMVKEEAINNFELKTKGENDKRIYYFKCDEGSLDVLNQKFDLKYLPHPYFGNITSPEVLFLAKNPSIDKFDGKDLENFPENADNDTLNAYIGKLSSANFIDIENENNKYISSSIKWWNENVFGDIGKINTSFLDNKKMGILQLCPYHSNSYESNLKLETKKKLFEQLEKMDCTNLKLIVVVWGKPTWDDFIYHHSIKHDNLDSYFYGIPLIVLNKMEAFSKMGAKYAINVNKISDIIDDKKAYKNRYEEKAFGKFTELFQKESQN